MEILEKLNEKYVDELAGLIPIHRVVSAFIAIPPFLVLLDGHADGILSTYTTLSPARVFSFEQGLLWTQPWAFWLLLLWVLLGGVMASELVRQIVISAALMSTYRPDYLKNIQASADAIRTALGDTKPLENALEKKYSAAKRKVHSQTKLSELVVSSAFLFLCFVSRGDAEDMYFGASLMVAGILLEVSAYRAYIRSVAPSYLLLGHLSKSFYQLEDGYYP